MTCECGGDLAATLTALPRLFLASDVTACGYLRPATRQSAPFRCATDDFDDYRSTG